MVSRRRPASRISRGRHSKPARRGRPRAAALSPSPLGVLASGIAHEINNPLAGLIGGLQALARGAVPEARRHEYFAAMHDALERIRAAVSGLLDYAHERRLSPSAVGLAELLTAARNLVEPSAASGEVSFAVALSTDVSHVWADAAQLLQALVHVLRNAVQAAPRASHIDIEILTRPRRVGIAVTDDGPGIPPALRRRVCDPFFTTKEPGAGGGAGLGLAIAQGIVRTHGGRLEIGSAPGRGARVTLWLPASPRKNDVST